MRKVIMADMVSEMGKLSQTPLSDSRSAGST